MGCSSCGGKRPEARVPNNGGVQRVVPTPITVNRPFGGTTGVNSNGSHPFGNLKYGPKR